MIFLFLISFLGYVFFISNRLNWQVETLPFFIVSGIISFLYFCGLGNFLRPGAYLIFGLGIFLFAVFCITIKKKQIPQFLTPAIIGFVVFSALIWLKLHSAVYSNTDEFSHWGIVTKEIFLRDTLIQIDSAVSFKDYPPGTALFHYLVVRIIGYSEGATFFAHNILLISPFICMLQNLNWKKLPVVVFSFVFYYIINYTFGPGFQSILADQIVGVFFGMAVVSYALSRDTASIYRLIPTVLCLPLIKNVGIMLSLILILTIFISEIWRFFRKPVIKTENAQRSFGKHEIKIAAALILLCAALFISVKTWDNHLQKISVAKKFDSGFSLSKIQKSFSEEHATKRDKETIANFFDALHSISISSPVGMLFNTIFKKIKFIGEGIKEYPVATLHWFLIFTVLSAVIFFIQPPSEMRSIFLICYLVMFIGCIVYLFGLLMLYLYLFSEYEGTRLASFYRYVGIYFIGWGMLPYAFFLNTSISQNWHRGLLAGKLIILIIGILTISPRGLAFLIMSPSEMLPARNVIPIREKIQNMAARIKDIVDMDKKVYIIWQNGQSEYIIMVYELSPRQSNTWCWTIGYPHDDEDIWTCNIPVEEFLEKLRGYDYLFIANCDETFCQRYGVLFENGICRSNSLFRIERIDKNIRLIAEYKE